MSKNKTVPNDTSVSDYLAQVTPESKRQDAETIAAIMSELSGQPATLWGGSIIGFGQYHYRYESGREGDFMRVGFSPRKNNFSLYIMGGFDEHATLLKQLGKHKLGKSCLYIKQLADVDQQVLRQLISDSLSHMQKRYPES